MTILDAKSKEYVQLERNISEVLEKTSIVVPDEMADPNSPNNSPFVFIKPHPEDEQINIELFQKLSLHLEELTKHVESSTITISLDITVGELMEDPETPINILLDTKREPGKIILCPTMPADDSLRKIIFDFARVASNSGFDPESEISITLYNLKKFRQNTKRKDDIADARSVTKFHKDGSSGEFTTKIETPKKSIRGVLSPIGVKGTEFAPQLKPESIKLYGNEITTSEDDDFRIPVRYAIVDSDKVIETVQAPECCLAIADTLNTFHRGEEKDLMLSLWVSEPLADHEQEEVDIDTVISSLEFKVTSVPGSIETGEEGTRTIKFL